MLNVFPELLDFGFVAPAFLRIAIAAFFISLGYQKFHIHKDSLTEFLSSLKINPAKTIVQFLGGVEVIIGIMFVLGILTQIAALIGGIIAAVSLVLTIKEPSLHFKKPAEYAFVILICLSLLFTGAGIFAIDLPL